MSPATPDEVHALLEGDVGAAALDDQVGTASVGELEDLLTAPGRVGGLDVEDEVGPHRLAMSSRASGAPIITVRRGPDWIAKAIA